MKPRRTVRMLGLGALLAMLPATVAWAAGGEAAQLVLPVLVGLIVIIVVAKIGGEVFERLGQPAVLGELLGGVLIGNLGLVGFRGLDFLRSDGGLALLGELGVILLLFQVGLHIDARQMRSVGASSLLVAVLGVIAPFAIGWFLAAWFFPQEHTLAHAFVGATLSATSVGITARVLADLGKLETREASIILGAAVIDDVLALIVLAVVSGLIRAAETGVALSSLAILWIILKALAFLVGSLALGGLLAPRLFRVASYLRVKGMLLATALVVCFGLSWLSSYLGLATIVGAFAAGLLLDPLHYRNFRERGEHGIEELVEPIAWLMVPVFFVLMGVKVDLRAFGDVGILGFATLLTLGALAGKMICGLGVLEKGTNRLAVAFGMVPRGEVGLIFASIGSTLILNGHPVISASLFSAVVIMVIVTTVVAPPALKLTLSGGKTAKPEEGAPR